MPLSFALRDGDAVNACIVSLTVAGYEREKAGEGRSGRAVSGADQGTERRITESKFIPRPLLLPDYSFLLHLLLFPTRREPGSGREYKYSSYSCLNFSNSVN